MGLSTSLGDLFLFGLMHRTYCVSVFPMVSINSFREFLNFVATVSAAFLAPVSALGASSPSPKTDEIKALSDFCIISTTSIDIESLFRSSQPVVV
eukprot:CAMPEP_0115305836 /NCGR_PEP_ID=MMETSP0270-20121206/72246_1 /TAXON_ID=71861 /ORGANISM="Scrippsiella trochoidea, Strain CCMP3099" /LENGTH=94 /DNA_ID=CAMNT_0002724091 /DNA_START=172 /DNA_END=456 /DNA_ORIENTATION=-